MPGECIVPKTRTSNGTGRPMVVMPDRCIQLMSQSGGADELVEPVERRRRARRRRTWWPRRPRCGARRSARVAIYQPKQSGRNQLRISSAPVDGPTSRPTGMPKATAERRRRRTCRSRPSAATDRGRAQQAPHQRRHAQRRDQVRGQQHQARVLPAGVQVGDAADERRQEPQPEDEARRSGAVSRRSQVAADHEGQHQVGHAQQVRPAAAAPAPRPAPPSRATGQRPATARGDAARGRRRRSCAGPPARASSP